ncbi:UDP-glycosyltransferase [Melia azedarach]|uniref:UDP-glycosyltransferase n=1 Tax=Melia azedarach TaxID=155640 RepID=A0ACC1Y7H9_MELAZ|nr:UDP-glycosyltransferase [Melia azedarach]
MEMEAQGQRYRHKRVVLVPCPFQGHITPMLQLGTILYSKGFSITVIHTHFNSPNTSTHPEFKFHSIPDGLSHDDILSGNAVAIITLLNFNCRATFHECLVQMMKQHHPRDEIVCVIYDEFMYFSEAAANRLKLQSIILRTSSATTQISREVLLKLIKEGYTPLRDPRLQDPVSGLYPLRFKDLPIAKSGMSENYLRLITDTHNVRKSSAVIWNTMNCIEQSSLAQVQQECQVPIFPIGPLHKFAPSSSSSLLKEDTSCISWLNNQAPNSVIYISLGSIASMDKKELEEMAWGLVNSKQPFLWVIRPGSTTNAPQGIELLPEGIKEAVGKNGCIVKWAPQKEVLAHVAVGGFWSHCGWNSTLESIGEGVPMICRPNFGDQTVNASAAMNFKEGLQNRAYNL